MHRWKLLAIAVLAAIAAVPSAQAHNGGGKHDGGDKEWTVVASGLDNPRSIDIAKNGDMWIAESGRGGDGPCVESEGDPMGPQSCFGLTGAFTLVRDGVQKQVVTGLPSFATEGTGDDAEGPTDIVSDGRRLIGLIGGGHSPLARSEDPRAALFGWVVKVNPWKGTVWPFADIVQNEEDTNPDLGDVDSNAFDLALRHGGYLVADAGGNAVLGIKHRKHISTVAVFPDVDTAAPDGSIVPMQAVPTSIALRRGDKNIYVGQLTGFPFPPGGASVFRVAPDGTVDAFATGFTNIVEIAWGGNGSLYVLEISALGLLSGKPEGALIRVWPNGKQTPIETKEPLIAPTALGIAKDGTVYVANYGTTAGAGTIVSLGKV
jgi:hypothetical protein